MFPYKHNIKYISDVQDEYPAIFDIGMLRHKKVKQFTEEELQILTDNYLDECQFNEIKPIALRDIQNCFRAEAQAKSIISFPLGYGAPAGSND